ncbi:DUF6279 family lipoprotein [Microbulbifer sp.]|uniref:DUF6279 family lipoprotein n=1 Tax=Microbulbifer sp. TaxID=1908541 RepID=UPI0025884740|nr:DUF6279 family lipoprotein [Microbulbifer sp.]
MTATTFPQPATFRFPRMLPLALALLLMLSGCSSVRLVYGHLDWWMERNINKYLDLGGAQEDLLELRIDEFHRWHRQTQLPRYADFFEQLAGQVDINAAPTPTELDTQLAQIETRVDGLWHNTVVMLSDLILPLVIQLDPAQIDRLEENIREEQEESRKKWEKTERKRIKEFRKQADRWLGDVTDEQQAIIDRHVATTQFDPKLRDAQRQRWAQTFLQVLREKPEGYRQQLRKMLVDPQSLWPADYQKMRRQLRTQARQLASELLLSATPEQRQHLKHTLREYAEDFRHLAAQKH